MLSKGEIVLKIKSQITQYPIKLAYAITVHKAQGLTFEKINIDLSASMFAENQLYVALSRVKSPSGLCLINY